MGRKAGRPIPIDVKGGRSSRYVAGETTHTGRARSKPRCPDFVGAAITKAIKSHAGATGQSNWGKTFLQACSCESAFAAIAKRLDALLTCYYRPLGRELLSAHRETIVAAGPEGQLKALSSSVRVFSRKAAAAGSLPTLGIPPADVLSPPTFWAWIEDEQPSHCRQTPLPSSGEGPLEKARAWGLSRTSCQGVIVFSRARDTVASWQKRSPGNAALLPPVPIIDSIVHQSSLPAAIGSKGDHYFLWTNSQQRYLSVKEVARSLGVRDGSPLLCALCQIDEIVPASAVECCGNAIHSGVARLILRRLWEEGTLNPSAGQPIRYASGCSSIDFFAEAVTDMWPGAWHYCHASESKRLRRLVLEHAWMPDEIFADATDPDGRIAAQSEVDLYVLSPNCQPFSKRNKKRNDGGALDVFAGGATDVAAVVAPVVGNYRARVVVVENVATPEAIDIVGSVLRRYDRYVWREQTIDAKIHAGYPVARERHFWVGVLSTA